MRSQASSIRIAALLLALSTSAFGRWFNLIPFTSKELRAVSFADASTGYAGGEGGVWKTTDGGYTWQSLAITINANSSINCLYFRDAQTGWVGSGSAWSPFNFGQIHATQDGGKSWNAIAMSFSVQSIHVSGDTGYAVGGGTNEATFGHWYAIARSVDGGLTWSNLGVGGSGLLNTVRISASGGAMAAGYGALRRKPPGGGQIWDTVQTGRDATLSALAVPDAATGYIAGGRVWDCGIGPTSVCYEGLVLKSTDGGASWAASGPLWNERLYGISFTDAKTGWAVGERAIIHTGDGGATWSAEQEGGLELKAVDFPSATVGYAVGRRGAVYKYVVGVAVFPKLPPTVGPRLGAGSALRDVNGRKAVPARPTPGRAFPWSK